MPNELKPCPFCGSNETFKTRLDDFTYVIQCLDCGATGPYELNEDEAIEAWNRRAKAAGYYDSLPDNLKNPRNLK